MKKTGQLLKEAREAAGLSLSEVALATKISLRALTAIEAGEESGLPAKTIVKGFIRSYAGFLKMDADQVMQTFQEETSTTYPEHVVDKTDPSARKSVEQEGSPVMRAAAVVVIIVLMGLILGVRELIEKYQREKVIEPPVGLKTSPLVPEPAPQETKPEEQKAVEVAPSEPTAPVAPEPPAAPAVEPVKPEPQPEVKAEAKPEEPSSPLKTVKSEIILEALDKVEVKFQIQGETKRISLAPTQVHTIRAEHPLILDVSDGGAVNIILNGRERGVPGDLGKPKQIKIP